MVRNAMIAVSACLYLALSVWLVAKQGQVYRDGLRRDRQPAVAAEQPTTPQPESKAVAPTQAAAAPAIAAARPESANAAATTALPVTKKTEDHPQMPQVASPSPPKTAASKVAVPALINPPRNRRCLQILSLATRSGLNQK